jgi:hypothetical protein
MSTTQFDELPGERQAPKRRSLNFWVDLLATMQFSVLLGSGILMKFILPPGTCDAPVLKTWLGHARHWWGDIHWWIAVSLIVTIVLHVYLHWKWVASIWGRLVGTLRSPKTWALSAGMALLMALPLIIPPHSEVLPASAATAAGEPGVAPCGIAGLSCADCPASADRLFGGKGCAEAAKDGAQPPADCAACPSEEGAAGKQGEQDGKQPAGDDKQPPADDPPSRLF